MIKVLHGSIFDAKCDLLVVPCDDEGGVTYSVASSLEEKGLPVSIGSIPCGEVHFRNVRYENASVIAYAASVDSQKMRSNKRHISKITRSIASYCAAQGLLSVNLPLLGSGAGGLSHLDSFAALKSALPADDGRTYNIYCYARGVYDDLVASTAGDMALPVIKRPRVFVSYTGLDPDNALWVRALVGRLRASGVDARLDAFHLKPGADLPQWMTNEVVMADKVLLICDRHYMEKADFRKGGVGWETMIIQGDMLAQGDHRHKYIALVRESKIDEALPIYMKSKLALSWGNSADITDEKLRDLLLCLFDCDDEPALGDVPSFILEKLADRSKVGA